MKRRRPPAASRVRRVFRPARHRPPLFRRDRRQPDPARHDPGAGHGLPHRHAGRRGREPSSVATPASPSSSTCRSRRCTALLQAKPDVLARLGHIPDPKRRLIAAVLASLDEGVGRILGGTPGDRRGRTNGGPVSLATMVARRLRTAAALRQRNMLGGRHPSAVRSRLASNGARRHYLRPAGGRHGSVRHLPARRRRHAFSGRRRRRPPALSCAVPAARRTPTCSGAAVARGATRKGEWKLVGSELYNLRLDIAETTERCRRQPRNRRRSAPGPRRLAARPFAPPLW